MYFSLSVTEHFHYTAKHQELLHGPEKDLLCYTIELTLGHSGLTYSHNEGVSLQPCMWVGGLRVANDINQTVHCPSSSGGGREKK